jgi:outer membrane protein assembly factor BamB
MRLNPALVALVAASLTACSGANAPSSPTPPSGASFAGVPDTAASDWLTYHHDLARTGRDANSATAGGTIRHLWTSAHLDGAIYAEPLVAGQRVFVATENDSVYALSASSGQVLWRTHLGTPMAGDALPCGDISPSGITSTPVIDSHQQLLYAVGFVEPGRHLLFALNLGSGSVRFSRPVDPTGSTPLVQQQRSALALSDGRVYIPFGGLFGDCGDYHGYVLAVPESGTGSFDQYQVPASREGAIWAPSGEVFDAQGDLYVATGNTPAAAGFDFGDSVVRLSPTLRLRDWWAPTDWAQLGQRDTDIGSIGPALLTNGLVFQSGKNGQGYLLRADHLGGVGGEAFKGPVCSAGAFGGTALMGPDLYVPCLDGLVALRVSATPPSFRVTWLKNRIWAGPPIIALGLVWTIDIASGQLDAFDPLTGAPRYSAEIGTAAHFATPAAAQGRVYAAASDAVEAFGA